MRIEQRANIRFCFKHLPKLIKWWKKFMATIVYSVAAFTSGLNVFKRDGRLWKTMNVRAGQEMLCVESIAEIHGSGIRNIRSVDLSYFDRKFGVHEGLCQICCTHFKTTRKRPQNSTFKRHQKKKKKESKLLFAWYGTIRLLLVHLAIKGKRWRWCYSKGFDRHSQRHTEGWPKKVIR